MTIGTNLTAFEIPNCFCGLQAATIHPPLKRSSTSSNTRSKSSRHKESNSYNHNNSVSRTSFHPAHPDRMDVLSTDFFRTATHILSDTTAATTTLSTTRGDAFLGNWDNLPSSSSSSPSSSRVDGSRSTNTNTVCLGVTNTTTPPNAISPPLTGTNVPTTTTTTAKTFLGNHQPHHGLYTNSNNNNNYTTDEFGPHVHTSNWVYECHFTPQQQGMNPPEPCSKCDLDARRARGEPETEVIFQIPKSSPKRMWSTARADTEPGWGPVDETKSLKDYYNPNNIHNVNQSSSTRTLDKQPTAPIPPFTSNAQSSFSYSTPSSSSVPFSAPEPEKKQTPAILVCGFHMHAIEWHTIQEMEDQDDTDFMIALTRRANCPVFNLSITRWLNCGLNTLELEPFNSINCFCNQPMVVSPMQSLMHPNRRPQAYDLVCRNRDIRTRTVPVTTSTRTREPQSCSRVGSIHKIRYPARQTPVHTDGLIQSDLWLQRVFGQGQPPEMYFLPASNSIDPVCDQQGLRSILHSKRFSLDFSRPPRFLSPRSASPSSGSLSKVSSVFSPDCYLHGKKNLSFREPIEEVISDGYQYNPSDGGTRTNGPPRRWAPNLWSSAQWSQSVYSSAIARPDALAILRGQTPYEEAIVLSAKFGHTRLAPETADRYLIRASDSMILWNERQETDDQVATTELTSATRTNNEAVEQVRAVHVRLVKELNRMKQNASLMPSNHKCKVCFEGFLTDILLPCGHLVLCKDCLRLVTVCPICRRSLTGKQRISWGSKIGGTELARRELNSVV